MQSEEFSRFVKSLLVMLFHTYHTLWTAPNTNHDKALNKNPAYFPDKLCLTFTHVVMPLMLEKVGVRCEWQQERNISWKKELVVSQTFSNFNYTEELLSLAEDWGFVINKILHFLLLCLPGICSNHLINKYRLNIKVSLLLSGVLKGIHRYTGVYPPHFLCVCFITHCQVNVVNVFT